MSLPTNPSPTDPLITNQRAETGSIVRWRFLAMAMQLAGGVMIELALAVGWVTTESPLLAHGAALAFVGLAGLVSRVTLQSYRNLTRLVIVLSIVLITMLGASFRGVITIPFFYLWPLLGATFLLSRAELIGYTVLSVVACAIATIGQNESGPLGIADYLVMLIVGATVLITVRALAENLGTTIGSLRHTSSTDPLTGLLNRRSLAHRFARQFDRSKFDGKPIACVLLDIDHFKAINDLYGHPVGDQSLVRFTELLVGSCRASDIIARVGGEEFCVVMPGATTAQAVDRADRFLTTLREDRSIQGVLMTASAGIATRDSETESWESMMVSADEAVYEAKRTGRDRIVIAGAEHSRAPTSTREGSPSRAAKRLPATN